jgi:hypothetical protein
MPVSSNGVGGSSAQPPAETVWICNEIGSAGKMEDNCELHMMSFTDSMRISSSDEGSGQGPKNMN